MSRHRDIRNMDYSEDYDGYNDVYGHSVDDDYYISPSNRQFLYNRESSQTEKDIKEEDEAEAGLSDLDKARLESCLEQIKNILGSVSLTRNELVNIIVGHKFNIDRITNDICEIQTKTDETKTVFKVPKFNGANVNNVGSPGKFIIPKIGFPTTKIETADETDYSSLSALVSSHLNLNLGPNKPRELTEITNSLSICKLSEPTTSKSLPGLSLKPLLTSNDFQIDLTKALKPTGSAPVLKPEVPVEEKFEISFMEYSETPTQPQVVLSCSLDASSLLDRVLNNWKQCSGFGRVLCKKYKRLRRDIHLGLGVVDGKCCIRRFRFLSPSPDDVVGKALRR